MKTNIIQLGLVLYTLVLISCEKTNDVPVEKEKTTKTAIESSYNLLDIKPNVYHKYFKESDNTIGYSSLKSNPLQEASLVQHSSLNPLLTQKGSISINGVNLKQQLTSRKLSASEFSSIYGKTLSFKINAPNSKTGKVANTEEVVMYVPNIVRITNPAVKKEQEHTLYVIVKSLL